jgi:excisionase family DNA binding protein
MHPLPNHPEPPKDVDMTNSTAPSGVTLLQVKETQIRLGRGRAAIFQLIKDGELEAIHFGPRSVRIPSDSVDAYIERCRRDARRARSTSVDAVDLEPQLSEPA